jgi:hypothetical protein
MDFSLYINDIRAIFLGIIASFFSAKIFLRYNNAVNKPEITISNYLIKTKRQDNTNCLLIKIINNTKADLTDIIINVEGINNISPKNSTALFILTPLSIRKLFYLPRFKKHDKDALYAHRTKLFNEDFDILEKIKKFEKIRVSIRATCPEYNTSTIVSKDYIVKSDILDNTHKFNTGNSIDTVA